MCRSQGSCRVRMEQAKLHALAERLGIVKHRGLKRAYYGSPWLPPAPARGAHDARPTVSAFYVPWDDGSAPPRCASMSASSTRSCRPLASVTGPNHDFRVVSDPRLRCDHRQCAAQAAGAADGAECERPGRGIRPGLAALLHDPAARARLIGQVGAMLAARHGRRHRVRFRGAAAERPARLPALPRREPPRLRAARAQRRHRRSRSPTRPGTSPITPRSPTSSS